MKVKKNSRLQLINVKEDNVVVVVAVEVVAVVMEKIADVVMDNAVDVVMDNIVDVVMDNIAVVVDSMERLVLKEMILSKKEEPTEEEVVMAEKPEDMDLEMLNTDLLEKLVKSIIHLIVNLELVLVEKTSRKADTAKEIGVMTKSQLLMKPASKLLLKRV